MKQKLTALKKRSGLIFLIIGLFILACLIYFMDTRVILESFELLGFKIFFVFAVAPLWMICNTLCLSTLLKHQVPFHHLLYNQVTCCGFYSFGAKAIFCFHGYRFIVDYFFWASFLPYFIQCTQ